MKQFQVSTVGILLVILLAGCGGRNSPPLGKVTGKVTLDGQPLSGAKLEFQPEGAGSPSYGRTDSQGEYELMYSVGLKGALVGKHKVRITTGRQEQVEGQPPREIPERVPPQYNRETTLMEDVKSGSQTINFDLAGALSE